MKLIRLRDVASIQLGKMLSPKSKTGRESYPYLRNQNVQWGRLELTNLAKMDFPKQDRIKFELKSGDLLVCEGGEPGRCTVWRDNIKECYYQKAIHRVRPNPSLADPDFLAYWIRLQALIGSFEDQNAKTTISHLPLVRLEQMPVPALTIEEQRRIVSRLNSQLAEVETARQSIEFQSKNTEALRAAIYRDAFACIVPVAVPPNFHDPPPGWRWHALTDIASLESGHTPSRSRDDWWGGEVSWISLTEIRALDGQWVERTQLRTNAAGIANSSARILPRGTVCYSRTASVGFVAIMAQPMATSQDFANWVCSNAIEPEFLMHALIRARTELREIATGATHKTIYMPALKTFHLCMPSPDTQRRIVRLLNQRLNEVASMRAALDAQMAELSALPQHLLSLAFEH